MGGVGKTPVVAHLADLLSAAGKSPKISTREPAASRPRYCRPARWDRFVDLTGDEAQMFVRAGTAHVGVADRFTVGLKMESQMHPGVFLLDDGQHVRLKRDATSA